MSITVKRMKKGTGTFFRAVPRRSGVAGTFCPRKKVPVPFFIHGGPA